VPACVRAAPALISKTGRHFASVAAAARRNGWYTTKAMSCRGLIAARQLILFSLDSMGYGRCIQVGRRFPSIYRGISRSRTEGAVARRYGTTVRVRSLPLPPV
jgi:hypothetical protein